MILQGDFGQFYYLFYDTYQPHYSKPRHVVFLMVQLDLFPFNFGFMLKDRLVIHFAGSGWPDRSTVSVSSLPEEPVVLQFSSCIPRLFTCSLSPPPWVRQHRFPFPTFRFLCFPIPVWCSSWFSRVSGFVCPGRGDGNPGARFPGSLTEFVPFPVLLFGNCLRT